MIVFCEDVEDPEAARWAVALECVAYDNLLSREGFDYLLRRTIRAFLNNEPEKAFLLPKPFFWDGNVDTARWILARDSDEFYDCWIVAARLAQVQRTANLLKKAALCLLLMLPGCAAFAQPEPAPEAVVFMHDRFDDMFFDYSEKKVVPSQETVNEDF